MTFEMWVMLGQAAGAGLPPDVAYRDKLDVCAHYLADVFVVCQLMYLLGASKEETYSAMDEAAVRFALRVAPEMVSDIEIVLMEEGENESS